MVSSFSDSVQRRDCNVNMPLLYQFRQKSIKESQKQSLDMRPIHISISHQYNFRISYLGNVKTFPDARTNCSNQVRNFFVSQNLDRTGFFNVQWLSSQRQNRLCLVISRLNRSEEHTSQLHS